MIPLIRAQQIAAKVVEQLRPFAVRIEIAGSIRRQRPEVGAIDLVIEARDRTGLDRRIVEKCKLEAAGQDYVRARMPDGTQIDLWFSYTPRASEQREFFARTTKPDNFGCLLLSKTGSVAHNITLVERAKRLGRSWNPAWGVYQSSQCIASATEADIYHALGMELVPPTEREFATRSQQMRFVRPEVAA